MRKIAFAILVALLGFSFLGHANSADENIEKISNDETELNFLPVCLILVMTIKLPVLLVYNIRMMNCLEKVF